MRLVLRHVVHTDDGAEPRDVVAAVHEPVPRTRVEFARDDRELRPALHQPLHRFDGARVDAHERVVVLDVELAVRRDHRVDLGRVARMTRELPLERPPETAHELALVVGDAAVLAHRVGVRTADQLDRIDERSVEVEEDRVVHVDLRSASQGTRRPREARGPSPALCHTLRPETAMVDDDLNHFVFSLRDALARGDMAFLFEHFDRRDVAEFQERIVEAALLLARVGGGASLARRLGVRDLGQAGALAPLDFLQRLTGAGQRAATPESEVEIVSIEQSADSARIVVRTTLRPDANDDEEAQPFVLDREHALVRRADGWRLRFALEALADALNVWIDDAQELERRAVLDRTHMLARIDSDDDLEPVAVHGFANTRGVVVIQPRFKAVQPFSEGLAAVKFLDLWGYIDRLGRVAIAPRFLAAKSFSAGSAAVSLDGEHWGLIDRDGQWIAEPDDA